MALIRCLECGRDISDRAVTCPQCGAPTSSTKTGPTPAVSGKPAGIHLWRWGLLIILAFIAYRIALPQLVRTGVVTGPRFAIDSAGGDDSCTVLGDYCMRVRCSVTNTGEAAGTARIAAELLEDGVIVATHTATTQLLGIGQHQVLTLDFPEATLASKKHQYRCFAPQ